MSVRIIAGSLSGRVIKGPAHAGTRPTTDMWRSAVFSALEHHIDIEGATVLDLCCGTGAFGFECISRGAKKVVFVDSQQTICYAITTTANEFDVTSHIEVHCMDLFDYLRRSTESFDIIFADPPYAMKACNRILTELAIRYSLFAIQGGVLILEHGDTEALLPNDHLQRIWYKERSQTVVEMYTKQAPSP